MRRRRLLLSCGIGLTAVTAGCIGDENGAGQDDADDPGDVEGDSDDRDGNGASGPHNDDDDQDSDGAPEKATDGEIVGIRQALMPGEPFSCNNYQAQLEDGVITPAEIQEQYEWLVSDVEEIQAAAWYEPEGGERASFTGRVAIGSFDVEAAIETLLEDVEHANPEIVGEYEGRSVVETDEGSAVFDYFIVGSDITVWTNSRSQSEAFIDMYEGSADSLEEAEPAFNRAFQYIPDSHSYGGSYEFGDFDVAAVVHGGRYYEQDSWAGDNTAAIVFEGEPDQDEFEEYISGTDIVGDIIHDIQYDGDLAVVEAEYID